MLVWESVHSPTLLRNFQYPRSLNNQGHEHLYSHHIQGPHSLGKIESSNFSQGGGDISFELVASQIVFSVIKDSTNSFRSSANVWF